MIKPSKSHYFCIAFMFLLLLTGCTNEDHLNLPSPIPSSSTPSPSNDVLEEQLDIVVFKIGKADSILLTVQDQAVLIDTGEDEDGQEVAEYLAEQQIDQIDYMIITHFDKDHVGGADTILNKVKVSQVLIPNYESSSKQYKQFIEALQTQELVPNKLDEDYSFQIGSVQFTVYPPGKKNYSGDNDFSLIVSAEHGSQSFLFSGDAEKERLRDIVHSQQIKHHTLLKVPHHGRYNDASVSFFEMISPSYAIITSSDKNPEDKEVVQALERLGADIYVTRKGNIYIKSNGESISISQ